MLYEIKTSVTNKESNNVKKSYLATEIELTKRNGLDAIKFLQEGKKRYTWIEFPNEYQMKKYFSEYEVIITEATTGRRIETFRF